MLPKQSITMFVQIKAQDSEGNVVIDEILYKTISIPRIGEYIMVFANKDFHFIKVILVVHKGLNKNSDFDDKNIQLFGIKTNQDDVFKAEGFNFTLQ
jgi:hypothetical protein